MCAWVAVGIAGGTALVKGITGAIQTGKANSLDRNNPFPTMPVQNEYNENLRQAQQMSQVGIPQQQYNNQLNSISRNQAGGLSALANSANQSAGIASIVRQGNDATNTLNAQDAMARNRNLLTLLQERSQLAQQKDKAWDWNYQQKYLGNLAKSNALRGAGNANINGAFSDASGLGTAMLGQKVGGGSDSGKNNNFGYGNQGYIPPNQRIGGDGVDVGGQPDVSYWGGGV